jgi:hypothetical protein
VDNISYASDKRLKTNIMPILNSLHVISSIQPVYYSMNTMNKISKLGFIAQNVEAYIPEVVHTSEDGYKSLEYSQMTAFILEGTKELYSHIKNQTSTLISLYDTILQNADTIKRMI